MLLQVLEPTHNVTGWLAQEKFDGFRAIWDGRTRTLYSRFGRDFEAPELWTAAMPDAVLDGELYHSRAGALAAVQSAWQLRNFSELGFQPFDAPLHMGDYTRRLEYVCQVCKTCHLLAPVTEVVRDMEHAREIARHYKRLGGEGAVFRDPAGLYKAGSRSWQVLKHKP